MTVDGTIGTVVSIETTTGTTGTAATATWTETAGMIVERSIVWNAAGPSPGCAEPSRSGTDASMRMSGSKPVRSGLVSGRRPDPARHR